MHAARRHSSHARRRLAPHPYSQAALQHLLGRGVDSLLYAPSSDSAAGAEATLPAPAARRRNTITSYQEV